MKALTLHQPWASLVAVGAKSIETRSWPTSYRGPLLIHAAKAEPVESTIGHPFRDAPGDLLWWLADEWTEEQQVARGLAPDGDLYAFPLPLGAVAASCVLDAVVPIVDDYDNVANAYNGPAALEVTSNATLLLYPEWDSALDEDDIRDVTAERPFGDYSPGRWAWLLSDVRPVEARCPRCWGEPMTIHAPVHALPDEPTDDEVRAALLCPTCRGGSCSPVPMRGRQGLWTPTSEDWSSAVVNA